jgi:hypothetical protein
MRTVRIAHSRVTEQLTMGSQVARVSLCWDTSVLRCGTEKPTSNASSLALGPNAEHLIARGRAHCLHIPTWGRAENVRRCVEVALGSKSKPSKQQATPTAAWHSTFFFSTLLNPLWYRHHIFSSSSFTAKHKNNYLQDIIALFCSYITQSTVLMPMLEEETRCVMWCLFGFLACC